jgi:choline dehydrogenase
MGLDGPDHDFNGARQEGGAGLYQVTVTAQGRRSSAAVAFLDPVAASRPNLVERTDTLVCAVELDADNRATGVRTVSLGVERTFRALREVIVCAGAFESPKLLMLSGIGPDHQLAAQGIRTRLRLEGVGANLQDHLLLLMYWRTSRWGQRARFIAEAGLFTHAQSQSKDESPGLQYHFCAGLPGFEPLPGSPPSFIACPTLAQPKSRGRVSLLSADPRHPPRIEPNYLAEAADVATLREGVELAREIVSQPAFRGLANGELWPGAPPRTRGQIDAFVRATARTVWHPVGTCRMGIGEDAVVDPRLRVHGTQGLRVADASIMPAIIAGNTNAACILIGEKAADLIREDDP